MESSYKATYINDKGQQFPAVIFVSSVTLTIRYVNESGEQRDLNWLAEKIQSFEQNSTGAILFYQGSSVKPEQLMIQQQELIIAIQKKFRGYKFMGGLYHHTIGKTGNKIILILSVLVLLLALLYTWILPWFGERVAMNFSKEYEMKLGEQMYNSTISALKIDSTKTRIINSFFRELDYKLDYPISITVVESKEVNAFAIPGGHIVVYDAILEGMKTPEELAALLAHEASHTTKRHSLRAIFRGLSRQMFLLLLVGSDAGIVGFLAEKADALKGLQYSRALETEADNNGMQLMYDSKINAAGMLRLMELLQKGTIGKEPAVFLSTHPVFKDRVENIRRQLKKYPAEKENSIAIKKLFHDLYEEW
ncbi:MAG: M48 family metallopeptidase [Chitinophagaceae bacterium]